MQFVHADQQNDDRDQQRRALDVLLPELALLALLLQQHHETVEVTDERLRLGLERRAIAARQCRPELLLPQALDVVEGLVQGGIRVTVEQMAERFAVQPMLHVVAQPVDLLRGRVGLQLPGEAVGRHAQ
ncbi:hypothetical protein D9M68_649290 [compost metagenome]